MNKQNKSKGFTLIELMLVVLIIGILSGIMLGIINVKGIQQKSRDARRISDMKKLQTALELYYADRRGYPLNIAWNTVSTALSASLVPGYLTKMPSDPLGGTTTTLCFGKNTYGYYYITPSCSGTGCLPGKYVLGAIMEFSTSAVDSLCKNLNNCSGTVTCVCTGASFENYCYGVENPL
jgi:general secretion pathway protein G